jgi:hypothetical protein
MRLLAALAVALSATPGCSSSSGRPAGDAGGPTDGAAGLHDAGGTSSHDGGGGPTDGGATSDTGGQSAADGSSGGGWRCGENTSACECYDIAGLPTGYDLTACSSFPCCITYIVSDEAGVFPGCDCYTTSYLSGLQVTCAGQQATIDGEGYSSATIVATCPP